MCRQIRLKEIAGEFGLALQTRNRIEIAVQVDDLNLAGLLVKVVNVLRHGRTCKALVLHRGKRTVYRCWHSIPDDGVTQIAARPVSLALRWMPDKLAMLDWV